MNKTLLGFLGTAALAGIAFSVVILTDRSGTGSGEPFPTARDDTFSPTDHSRTVSVSEVRTSEWAGVGLGDDHSSPGTQVGAGEPTHISPTPGMMDQPMRLGAGARADHSPALRRSRAPVSASRVEQDTGEVELQLARGVRAPLAALAPDEEITPVQANALAGISTSFLDRVANVAVASAHDAHAPVFVTEKGPVTRFFVSDATSGDPVAEEWHAGRDDADSVYRNIFGEAAYLRKSAEAALKARGETPPAR